MTAARIHLQLSSEGVPVVTVRDVAGVFSAVLEPTATPAQIARATELCASPPAPSAEEKADGVALPPRLLAALLLDRAAQLGEAITPAKVVWARQQIRAAGVRIDQETA